MNLSNVCEIKKKKIVFLSYLTVTPCSDDEMKLLLSSSSSSHTTLCQILDLLQLVWHHIWEE